MTSGTPLWLLIGIASLALTVVACGEGEEAPTPVRTVTPAVASPSPLATATPAVSPGQAAVVDLANVSALLTIYAADAGDLRNDIPSVAVGDFNGDGIGDLLLGARFGDGPDNAREDAGEAYVIFGSRDLAGTVDIAAGQQELTILGAKPGDNLGYSVAAADVNNDRLDDIIVSAPFSEGPAADYRTDRGEVYVIFGQSALGGTIDIADGRQQASVVGAEGFSMLGDSIAVGDVNGDGISDMILGAPFAGRVPGSPHGGPRTELGEVYVVLGSPALSGRISIPQGQQDFTISGPEQWSELGDAVAVGDVNGDGIDDIIAVGEAADGPEGSRPNAGIAYVIFGSASLQGMRDTAKDEQDVTILGADAQDALGFCAASGDVNGDAIDDIVLVAQRADGPSEGRDTAGEAYIIYGRPDLRGTIDTLKGDQDITIIGADAHDLLSSCRADRDVNGDGIDDIILGSSFARGPGNSRNMAGEAYVIFGSSELGPALDLAQGGEDVVFFGAQDTDRLGAAMASGDLNGDGEEEIILVASEAAGPANARPGAGEVYVIAAIGEGD
ncbi:MAG: hypothetical protein Q8P22_06710 [Chloroflexota bacterium]|nr:hypothetical protein [Chloroflexota bacterium]